MPVVLAKRRGKHRIVDTKTGLPATDGDDKPVDGGGRKSKFPGFELKRKAIEINEAERD